MNAEEFTAKVAIQGDTSVLDAITKRFSHFKDTFSHGTHGLGEHLEGLNHGLEGIQRRMDAFAAVEIIRGIGEMAERFANFGEELTAAAASAGITTEAMQQLDFAAAHSAVGAEELHGAMARLSRNLYEARKGSVQASEAFAAAGITPEQVRGFRTSEDALAALSDRFVQIQDPIKKQAIATELLGRGSYKLVGMMSKGSAALNEEAAAAKKYGAVLSNLQVEALTKTGEQMKTLEAVTKSLTASFAARLAPGISYLIQKVLDFVAANRKFIDANFDEWSDKVLYALGYVEGTIEGVIGVVRDFYSEHKKIIDAAVTWYGKLLLLSLGLGALLAPIQLVLAPFGSLISLVGGFASGVLKVGSFVSKFVFGPLGELSFKLAELSYKAFPALSKMFLQTAGRFAGGWITMFGPLAAAAISLAAIYASVQSIIDVIWNGKKFEDTGLGKFFDMVGLGGIGDIGKSLGLVDDYSPAAVAKRKQAESIPSSLAATPTNRYRDAFSVPNMPPASIAAPAAGGGAYVESTVTINVNGATDPVAIARQVKGHIEDARNQDLRQAHAASKSVKVN